MTALSDLITATVTITGRPDLQDLITQSIFKATLKEHAAIDYPRDLAELTPVALPVSTNWRYSLSLATLGLLTTMRKIALVREDLATDPSSLYSTAGYWGQLQFTEVSPKALFDGYALELYDYYYRQGSTLNIVASRSVDNIGIMYYKLPTVLLSGYSSWIADMYPYVIYEHAAADVFKAIGKDEEAATYRQKLPDNRLDVIRGEIGAI